MLAPLLKLAATSIAARNLRSAAVDAATRAGLVMGAVAGAVIAVLCFSRAALTLLERHMDPAEAWAVIGAFYGVLGGVLYLAATRRRRT
jgi:hypothetical protein